MSAIGAFVSDRRGQSEIIGAILLVVVSLILASFVAVYVFDTGGQQLQDSPPQVSVTFKDTGSGLRLTHDGGDEIESSRVEIVVTDDGTNAAPYAQAVGTTATQGATTRISADTVSAFGTTIEVGDKAVVAENVGDGDVVQVVYISPDTGRGTTLGKFQG